MIRIGPNEEGIIQDIANQISSKFNSVGLFHRVFFRIKTPLSIEKKLKKKSNVYSVEGKLMQDVFGIRATVYFPDDEDLAIDLVKSIFDELPDHHSIDKIDGERFGPVRCNLIFRLSESSIKSSALFDNQFIDTTFEVQFRTIFSEGWHEIEHDLRYKCKEDWEDEHKLSRHLNGQLAVLESCDWSMVKIFDDLAYKKYKSSEWISFFRNLLRIRFEDDSLSETIIDFLNSNRHFAKELLKKERTDLIRSIAKLSIRIPLLMDNVLFTINRYVIKNPDVINLEPPLLKQIFDLNTSPDE